MFKDQSEPNENEYIEQRNDVRNNPVAPYALSAGVLFLIALLILAY
ncbi:hypothetical protein PUV54_00795 [Hyphococcus flavus]|uniref:Uncharacterized protein n=1 Tax=Hyphococcus flavus TaxID=1866326 RepID=A0AAE9ZJK3_9PROT|nr:hypothetical protein [Hyphococcus flavus]WDI31725.1 hypothetical protein PUV54_00795 [Hyphococcus flavus]